MSKTRPKTRAHSEDKTVETLELAAFPSSRLPTNAKTISSIELAKLAYIESDDLPKAVVVMRARRMEWVGIGWIDCGEPRGDEVVVTK